MDLQIAAAKTRASLRPRTGPH